jgi:5'-deoxynucleotidase YfbR-like HD superfamily hydrolase
MSISTTTVKVIELAQLCLRFGRVNRATSHEDGHRPETDTDHTVMLSVIACAFAASYEPDLNLGKIAQFALVHDLVEAYAGDTNTLIARTEGGTEESSKHTRESAALTKITEEFADTFPWLSQTIEEYERLACRESRFVKTLDKVMPKITHILNKGAMLARYGIDADNLDAVNGKQAIKMLATYARDQTATMALYADIHVELKRVLEAKAE